MLNSDKTQNRLLLATLCLAVAVLAFSQPGAAQPAPIKIAVVDLDTVAANSSAGKALQARIGAFQTEIREQVKAKQDAATAIRRQIADGVNSLSEAKLADLQKQYEDAGIDLKRFQDDKQREGQKLQTEGLRSIEQEMEPVFEAIRDEEGYDLILNYVPGVVVMAGARVDITAMVIERMNSASDG